MESREQRSREEDARIRSNFGRLRKALNPRQRRRLLQILDDGGMIAEDAARESDEKDFRAGVKLMIESLYVQ